MDLAYDLEFTKPATCKERWSFPLYHKSFYMAVIYFKFCSRPNIKCDTFTVDVFLHQNSSFNFIGYKHYLLYLLLHLII